MHRPINQLLTSDCMKKTIPVILILLLAPVTQAEAQNYPDHPRDLKVRDLPHVSLPHVIPDFMLDLELTPTPAPSTNPEPLNEELLARLANIYRMHLLSIDAQVEGDMVRGEDFLNDALLAVQGLIDDHPDIQGDQRFIELYRTVMSEYRSFYGITGPVGERYGEIFAIRDEMFNKRDQWIADGHIVLPENMTWLQTEVPLIRNTQVNNQISYLTVRRPEIMERWLERAARYFPMMEEIFEDEGVPTELIHLALVESGLVPTARSHAHAVGMWQFIQATGSVYGLEVNWWMDERRDPKKATRAAARHLRDLYEVWGDWHLAMANYNLSGRGLRRAISRAGGTQDYWDVYPYLPAETRGYVPAFIATTLVANNPEEFGIHVDTNDVEPYSYEVAEVQGSIELSVLADAAGISTQKLREYNPELLRWATPPNDEPYPLKLPEGVKDRFAEAYKEISDEERQNNLVVHEVKRGENLGLIANRYGTSVRALYENNEGLSSTIRPGDRVVIPVPEGSSVAVSADEPSGSREARQRTTASRTAASSAGQPPENSAALEYTVKTGDTIGHIAEWYDTRASSIRAWNGIGDFIRPGQTLTLYVPEDRKEVYEQIDQMSFDAKQALARGEEITGGEQELAMGESSSSTMQYTVRPNDNLSNLASTFNTTVAEIMELNELDNARIYAGQTLQIPN